MTIITQNKDIQVAQCQFIPQKQELHPFNIHSCRFSLKLCYFSFMSKWDPLIRTNWLIHFTRKTSVKIPSIAILCKFYLSLFCRCLYGIILGLTSKNIPHMFCAQNEQFKYKCLKVGTPPHISSSSQFLYPRYSNSYWLIYIPGSLVGEGRESKSLIP